MTKLYVVPGSHPCATVMKALELKGVPYKRVDLVPAFHKAFMKAKFGVGTVPGVVLDDGTKVAGSRTILRELERRVPEPALYHGDVEEAERWGDDVLQAATRRLVWMALTNRPDAQLSVLDEDTKLFPPTPLAAAKVTARPMAWLERKFNAVTPEAVAADLEALPGHLDRVDAWIADGTLGGHNAADLQIGASVRLLLILDDLKPLIEGRPAAEHALRLFPHYPGRVPAGALPMERAAAAQPA
jgi:glutathione S-transferase